MKWRGVSESEPEPLKATLRDELDERRTLMRRFVPAATQAVNDRATEEFRHAALAQRALKIGDKAPTFTLSDARGKTVKSADLLSQGPLIVTFIRGRWCPFCCATLEAWQGALPQVKAAGSNIVAVTPMSVPQCDFMRDQHKIAFPILSDPGNKVASQFGIAYQVPDYQQQLFATVFINLPHINGDDSWSLPLPATFAIAPDGTIRYSWANEDYTLRAEPAEVLASLK
ncbi:MAG TPA: peroxiredoxin-like family protein [Terriglobales bacterium]|nr:peroxiredoxin-like family protein [Terriglobales bacterium]